MWFLCRLDQRYRESDHISLLRPGIEYIVGRKGKHEVQNPIPNKLTFSDKSVSRKHALIIVSGHSVDDLYKLEKRPKVVLKNTEPTYGTLRGNEKLEPNAIVTLGDYELLKFGNLFGLARLRWESIVVHVVPGFGVDERRIAQIASRLGIHLSKEWTDDCTHLCIEKITPTETLAMCLLQNKTVISSKWLQQLEQANDDVFQWPADSCLPEEVDDSNFIKSYECYPNPDRLMVFMDLHFLILDEKQYEKLENIIPLANGSMKCLPLKGRQPPKDLIGGNTIVVIPEDIGNAESAWNSIVETLEKSHLRPVAVWEIYCAIIKCSVEMVCNPRTPAPSQQKSVPPTRSSNFSGSIRAVAPDATLPRSLVADLLGEHESERSHPIKLEPETELAQSSFIGGESYVSASAEVPASASRQEVVYAQEALAPEASSSRQQASVHEASVREVDNVDDRPPQSLGNILDDLFGFGDDDKNDAASLPPPPSQHDAIHMDDEPQDIPFASESAAQQPSQTSVRAPSPPMPPSSPPLFLPRASPAPAAENNPESRTTLRRSTRRRNRTPEISQDTTYRELRSSTRRTDARHRHEEALPAAAASAASSLPEEPEENIPQPNLSETNSRRQDDTSDIESPVEEEVVEEEEEEEQLEVIPGKQYTRIDQADDLVVLPVQRTSTTRSPDEPADGPNFKRFKKAQNIRLEYILQYVEMQ